MESDILFRDSSAGNAPPPNSSLSRHAAMPRPPARRISRMSLRSAFSLAQSLPAPAPGIERDPRKQPTRSGWQDRQSCRAQQHRCWEVSARCRTNLMESDLLCREQSATSAPLLTAGRSRHATRPSVPEARTTVSSLARAADTSARAISWARSSGRGKEGAGPFFMLYPTAPPGQGFSPTSNGFFEKARQQTEP